MFKASKKNDIWMKCPHCSHQFNAVEDLQDHQNSHPPRKQWACIKCSYTADRQCDITRHNDRVHAERHSLDHDSSSEMTKTIRTAEKRKITPVPARDAEKEKGQLKVRPKTSMSPSTHSRPAPSTGTAHDSTGPTARSAIVDVKKEVAQKADFTGPTARSMIAGAKEEIAQKGLKTKRSEKKTGLHYRRVTEKIILPDGKMFKVETEDWDN